MLHATIKALVEAGVLIGAGAFAKHLGILSSVDAQVHSTMQKRTSMLSYFVNLKMDLIVLCTLQTGNKVAAFATLPSLALQVLSLPGTSAMEALCIAAASLAASVASAAIAW